MMTTDALARSVEKLIADPLATSVMPEMSEKGRSDYIAWLGEPPIEFDLASARAHDGVGDNVCWFCGAGPCTSACTRALEDGRQAYLDAAIDSTWDIERAAPTEAVRKAAHDLRWALVEHRAATEPATAVGPIHGKHTDLDAYCRANGYDIAGRTLDSTGHEASFDG